MFQFFIFSVFLKALELACAVSISIRVPRCPQTAKLNQKQAKQSL